VYWAVDKLSSNSEMVVMVSDTCLSGTK